MTDPNPRTVPSPPAPGGTATLAARPVARVGFGVMQLERAEPAAAVTILRQAVAGGVNHLDTAQFYGPCNDLIRRALAPYDDDLMLVSKVGAVRVEGARPPLAAAQRPAELRAQVEENLTALGTERLAVVNLRRLDEPPGIVAAGEQRVSLDDQLAELTALRAEGKIGGIGLSAVSAAQLAHARPAGIACVQNLYGVLDRTAEPVLEECQAHGIAWVPFFPLGGAFPGRPKAGEVAEVRAVADELGVTPGQVALAWLLAGYDQTLLIPGTSNPAHLAENLAAGDIKLPADALAVLDRLTAPGTAREQA